MWIKNHTQYVSTCHKRITVYPGSYLTVLAGLNHLPGLRVHIITVKLIGESVVSSASEYIQVPVKGHHSVSVASLRRRRRAPQ